MGRLRVVCFHVRSSEGGNPAYVQKFQIKYEIVENEIRNNFLHRNFFRFEFYFE
jgi:hypothetical protein